MAKTISYFDELKKLKGYFKSESNEDAKRPLLYPLFKKLFGDKFKIESDACGADVYIDGKIIVEAKTDSTDWLEGFYQALHYHKKFGLTYSMIIVIANRFIGIWKANKIPEYAAVLSFLADANISPNKIGKENAKKTTNATKKEIQHAAIYWLEPKDLTGNFFKNEGKSLDYEIYEILNILKNTDTERIQINTHNFIQSIEYFKKFFENPIDAIHCFYSIVAYWDITSTVATNDYLDTFQVIGFKGHQLSEQVAINSKYFSDLKKYIESHYIFTNQGSGLTIDYYFSRFDEALSAIDPEYVRQHGIFFTISNLGKFALWFASQKISERIGEDYIVFDPAGGSGNLISSWRMNLRHKIVSELQPDLLRTIERRMKIDPWHIESGFTIIPKTSEKKGLNFLDKSAFQYLEIIGKELAEKNQKLERQIAFLLNPPFKNTREEVSIRNEKDADYLIDPDIIEIAGADAVKERYLSFIAQIINICKEQNKSYPNQKHLLMVFTPTSWLIPRIAFKEFRKIFDHHFSYIDGFIVKSNEFFKIQGSWPVAFTIWEFSTEENRENKVSLFDLNELTINDLSINWNQEISGINSLMNELILKSKKIKLFDYRTKIKDTLPNITYENGVTAPQKMQNFYRSLNKDEIGKEVISGFALKDNRHKRIKAPHGNVDGAFVGFMDDLSPVRIHPKNDIRYINKTAKDFLWFRLDTSIKDGNKSKCFNGPTDNRSYCAYDLESAKQLTTWFAINKILMVESPIWANQYDVWNPLIGPESASYFHALCFAFVLAENRCVVMKFEKDNPVTNAPEIFVDNSLCPNNKESFWATTLDSEIKPEHPIAYELVQKIKELYKIWNLNYCKGQFLSDVGLKEEPYFNYFEHKDFLTPYSGLVQIRKYAQLSGLEDLEKLFGEIGELTKKVKAQISNLLINEYGYFE